MNTTALNIQNPKTIDSREVAEMTGKLHKNLLSDIDGYRESLTGSNLSPLDFFIESSYKDAKGETRRRYLVTRKGCELIAHKMTGEKGVRFSAAYINRFHEMEEALTIPALDGLSPQLQLLINMELKQKEQAQQIAALDTRIEDMRNVVALSPVQWRKETGALINKMAYKLGGTEHLEPIYHEIYALLETRFGVSLNIRLTNMRRRMAEQGVCQSKRGKVNRLDVIGEDRKLIEGYVAIVKEMAIKYGVAA